MDATEMEWEYRGKPEVSSIKIAFGKSGDVEIELIEWVSGKTPHKEFLDAGHEGLHHLRFIVDNLREKVSEAEGAGAAPLAALMQEREQMAGKKVGVILSGGNIDLDWFQTVLAGGVPKL